MLSLTMLLQAMAQPTKQDYLKKSRTQKTWGFLLLGGGLATAIVGTTLSGTYAEDAGKWMQVGGGVLVLSSFPLFIASSNNRKKADAMTLQIQTQPVNLPQYGYGRPLVQPAMSMRIRL